MKRLHLYYEVAYVDGHKRYQCPACLKVYSDYARAVYCCPSHKPWTPLKADLAALADSFHPKARRARHKNDPLYGIRLPGYLNTWYKGLNRYKRLQVTYFKAQRNIALIARAQHTADLEKLYPTPTPPPKAPRSPLQKMAFAFHAHNWDMARSLTQDAALSNDRARDDITALARKYHGCPADLAAALDAYLGLDTVACAPGLLIADLFQSPAKKPV